MLKKRIIPTMLMKNMGLVKDRNFKSERRVGSILPQIKVYNMRGVDEIIILDITSTIDEEELDIAEITEFCKHNFIPLTIGGGINKISQIKDLLTSGADKVSINTAAYYNKKFIIDAVKTFGSQCIVGSVDYRMIDGSRICFSNSGTKKENYDALSWIKEYVDMGIGELLLTSIDNDGLMNGYDFDFIRYISDLIDIPLISSGGAGSYKDISKAIEMGSDAVAVSSIFHFTELTPYGVKKYLKKNGIPVRL